MALNESSDIVLKAVLTRRGQELIRSRSGRFMISKFGLFDQEVNYGLIKGSDPDQNDIESLPVFDPCANTNELTSRLIRFSDNIQESLAQNQYQFVPNTEIQLKTKAQGSTVFSIESWKDDVKTISFTLLDPTTNLYFLSNGFTVDMSNFYKKYALNSSGEGVAFLFNPIFPQSTLGATNKYWYNASSDFKSKSGNVLSVLINIDDTHRGMTDTPMSNLTNSLGTPTLTFSLQLMESQIRDIYMYMLHNNISSITDDILISNSDTTIVPLTNFFGASSTFSSIAARVPVTITF